MILNKKGIDKQWFKGAPSGAEYCIRLFKFSEFKLDDTANALLEKFMYCLIDWKKIDDGEGKSLNCDKGNKLFLYDYHDGDRNFIFEKINEKQENFDKTIKN